MGYIDFSPKGAKDEIAFGVGGHLHIDTKSWRGLKANATFYTVQSLGFKSDNEDFYGERGDGFAMLSEANIEYYQGPFKAFAGRLIFDSPHADSDDIRMIPNTFEGVWICYKKDISFHLAHISKMAGWESGGDIAKFKPIYKVLGIPKSSGMNIAGIEFAQGAVWLYNIDEVANVLYGEYGIFWKDLHIGLQLDIAEDTGKSYMGAIQSRVLGMMAEYSIDSWTIMGAFNEEFGESGPMFSFGGGPFFTSMEDQTLDAIGTKEARAYTLGISYSMNGMEMGAVYGKFKGDGVYNKDEIDFYISGNIAQKLTLDGVYAKIDDRIGVEEYDIFRVILKYGF